MARWLGVVPTCEGRQHSRVRMLEGLGNGALRAGGGAVGGGGWTGRCRFCKVLLLT